jgi:DNA-binding NarL/FixJ family response regulator/tRNA A-37 threonylcarbamoyl transferase component Bud32
MSAANPITIQIAEDHAMTRFALKSALQAYPDLKVVAESADGVAAVLQALAVKPSVILMDIGLPKIDGIKASKQIKEALPGVRIIMFTASDNDENIYEALRAGADGYCLKNVAAEHLYSAIKAVVKGVAWLDPGIADRVLRSSHVQKDVVDPSAQKTNLSGNRALTENQMLILQLLSQGATLEVVAKKFNLSAACVAQMVNDTIARLRSSAAAHTPQDSLLEGEVPMRTMVGDRYSIESLLGLGGMGIVYKGKHLLMDRLVAIKMLHPQYLEDELVVKRFQREAKSLCALSHPNLVAVFDFGITPTNEPYMVMDYHDGKGLDYILENPSKIDLAMAIHVFCQVCDALTAVHEQNMVHRDVKPGNILVSEDGLVKLVDFGIAKSVDSKAMNLSMTGEIIGTPKYMSPEQCMGKKLDATSDIYALGCVMYEVFTGLPPFNANSFYDMVRQHVDETPSRLPFDQASVNVPAKLEAIVFKALEKERSSRQQTTAQLKRELLGVPLCR